LQAVGLLVFFVLTRFLARFQAKWVPVSRPESAPSQESERVSQISLRHLRKLDCARKTGFHFC